MLIEHAEIWLCENGCGATQEVHVPGNGGVIYGKCGCIVAPIPHLISTSVIVT
ncbi:hypothetical protein IG631_07413 [Alternaria alternata]|nr:hypothetical protein IG631_07413 [Alternaria alternata]